jgi:hypothetical protein
VLVALAASPEACTAHRRYDTGLSSEAGYVPTAPSGSSEAVVQIVDAIEARVESLVDDVVATIVREIPFYRLIPAEARQALRGMAVAEVASSLKRIRAGSRLIPLSLRERYRRQGERFAEQGIPLSDLTRTFEVASRVFVPEVIDEAMEIGPDGVAALGYYLPFAMDQLTSVVALVSRAYLDRANELALGRRRLRDELVANLLAGASADELAARATGLGLPRAGDYAVLVAPLPTGDSRSELGQIDRSVSAVTLNLWWVLIGHLIAVLVPVTGRNENPVRELARELAQGLATVLGGEPTVACGPARSGLAGIRSSFQEATAIANAARAASLHGAVGGHEVAIHRLLLASPNVGRELQELIAPLAAYDEAHGGSLIETLGAFLDANLSSVDAARILCVHRNTLRYRLDVIESLLGADLVELKLPLKLALIARDLDRQRLPDV